MKKQSPYPTLQSNIELNAAIETLLRAAQKQGYAVAGFLFGEGRNRQSPLFVNFGNCNDYGSEQLFLQLCELARKKQESGQCESGRVLPLQ